MALTSAQMLQAMRAVADPVQGSAVIGEYGRAWPVGPFTPAQVAVWVVEAPWAHPVWHSYIFGFAHLRPMECDPAPRIWLPGATHELALYALDPEVPRQKQIDNGRYHMLVPVNFAAQFIADDDAAAAARIKAAVDRILAGELSPDTDFLAQWIALFGGNMVLK